jgi:hypothetical protein
MRYVLTVLPMLAVLSNPAAARTNTEVALPRAAIVLGSGAAAGSSGAPSREMLTVAARQAVSSNATQLGIDAQRHLEPSAVHIGKHGPSTVTYRQTVRGIEVLGARIVVALDGAATVRAITGGFRAHEGAQIAAFKMEPRDALLAFLRSSEILPAPGALTALQPRHGYEYFAIDSPALRAQRPARIKPVFFPAKDALVAAYYIELIGRRGQQRDLEGWASVVAADDGRILQQASLIREAVHSYRVFADSSGVPLVDGYGNTFPHPTAIKDGWLPGSPAPMQRITLDHAGISTGDPWLPVGATHTIGNNVDAFFNGFAVSNGEWILDGYGPAFTPAEGDFRAPLSGTAAFEYPYDPTATTIDYFQTPGQPAVPIPSEGSFQSTQLKAKIVQAFYASNWLHDYFYDLGFDEPAGNMQNDNYGRGGLAGDRLIIQAGFNSTFVTVPADGEAPQLFLGRNFVSQHSRDPSGFDFPILAHEWGHILFHRLLGGRWGSEQNGALSEGTADFIGVLLNVRESHRDAAPATSAFSGAYALGAYFNFDYDYHSDIFPRAGSPGYPDNTYYHGIRRYPYSADMSLNPLTLRHIAHGNDLPATPPAFDWKARSLANPEVHSAGEVWASALWQCARNILADETRFAFDERKRRIFAYLVAGLKLAPADATFVEARDGVLFATRAADATDYELCRQGFALRGFGAGALTPVAGGNKGVRQSFSTSDAALRFTGSALAEISGGDADGVLDRGEVGRLSLTVRNAGFVPLEQVRIHVPPLARQYSFPSGSTTTGIVLQPGQEFTTSFLIQVTNATPVASLLFEPTAQDQVRTDVTDLQKIRFTVNYDLRRDSNAESLLSEQAFAADWTAGFGSGHGCPACGTNPTNWELVSHLGKAAYRVRSRDVAIDAHLQTVPFTVHPNEPLRVTMTHDWSFWEGSNAIEIRLDGGPWEDAGAYLTSGSSHYSGTSSGWRTHVLEFSRSLAGRDAQLRWRAAAGRRYEPLPIHWALSFIRITGSSKPIFSTVHADID